MDEIDKRYLEGRAERVEERRPVTLANNANFFEQFERGELELVRKVYNYVIGKVNW